MSSTNSWDNGPIESGNYWSDHGCVGNSSAEPYSIDYDGVDHYPVQDPNGWLKGIPDGNAITSTITASFTCYVTLNGYKNF